MVNDLLSHPPADVLEVSAHAVISESKDSHRVAANDRGADGPSEEHRRFAPPEHRRIAALRQVDDQFIGAPFLPVVVHEFRAKAPRLDAYDGVGAWIEGFFLPEHLDTDDVFLQLIAVPLHRLQHDEPQEPF